PRYPTTRNSVEEKFNSLQLQNCVRPDVDRTGRFQRSAQVSRPRRSENALLPDNRFEVELNRIWQHLAERGRAWGRLSLPTAGTGTLQAVSSAFCIFLRNLLDKRHTT